MYTLITLMPLLFSSLLLNRASSKPAPSTTSFPLKKTAPDICGYNEANKPATPTAPPEGEAKYLTSPIDTSCFVSAYNRARTDSVLDSRLPSPDGGIFALLDDVGAQAIHIVNETQLKDTCVIWDTTCSGNRTAAMRMFCGYPGSEERAVMMLQVCWIRWRV